MCKALDLDASFDSRRNFLMDLMPKIVENSFFQPLPALPKIFSQFAQTIKMNWVS